MYINSFYITSNGQSNLMNLYFSLKFSTFAAALPAFPNGFIEFEFPIELFTGDLTSNIGDFPCYVKFLTSYPDISGRNYPHCNYYKGDATRLIPHVIRIEAMTTMSSTSTEIFIALDNINIPATSTAASLKINYWDLTNNQKY